MSWDIETSQSIRSNDLKRLLADEIAAIRVPGFLSSSESAGCVTAINRRGFEYYEGVEPPIGRIGITQYEHMDSKRSYFDRAPAENELRRDMFKGAVDPVDCVFSAIGQAWGSVVQIARELDGREYFVGLCRLLGSGARIHCDWGKRDGPGWRIGDVNAQLAWNVYLECASSGGETVVFRRPWTPDVEDLANYEYYGYLDAAVSGVERVRIAPKEGQLLLFNSRNLHMVEPSIGSSARITVSSFVGRLPDGSLAGWS